MLIIASMKSTRGFSLVDKILANLIRWYTNSIYFHTECIYKGYWYTADVYSGRVIKRPLSPLKDTYDYTYIEITKEDEKILDKYFESILNREYDLKSIIYKQILHLSYNNEKDLFCTEVALKALKAINKCQYPDDGSITPKYIPLAFKNETKSIYTNN